jgi:regulator of RNase E activity RraA
MVATDESNHSAFRGEPFSSAAVRRDAVGRITDGNVRDVGKILAPGFAAFARLQRPIEFRGRLVLSTSQQPVNTGGVTISPGDLVAANGDGSAVIPQLLEQKVLQVGLGAAVSVRSLMLPRVSG